MKLLQSCQSSLVGHTVQSERQKITESLAETRYHLYKKHSSETNKLPPSLRALAQHVKRACCPLIVWASANEVETREVDPLKFRLGTKRWSIDAHHHH